MKLAIIGYGAIAAYAAQKIKELDGVNLAYVICRSGREEAALQAIKGAKAVTSFEQILDKIDLVIECGGHEAFRQHGFDILGVGVDIVSVSSGVMANADDADRLAQVTGKSGAKLQFVTGAIGAMDALNAGAIGGLTSVTYTGRKKPAGWKGSRAEEVLDLDSLTEPALHFEGTAREAASLYPKNANVAATIAMSGIGMEDTKVQLYADPTVQKNIHEIAVEGEFGSFTFRIEGSALPENPKSSALTAMSLVEAVARCTRNILT